MGKVCFRRQQHSNSLAERVKNNISFGSGISLLVCNKLKGIFLYAELFLKVKTIEIWNPAVHAK